MIETQERDTPRSPGKEVLRRKGDYKYAKEKKRGSGNNYVNVSKGKDENWLNWQTLVTLRMSPKTQLLKDLNSLFTGYFKTKPEKLKDHEISNWTDEFFKRNYAPAGFPGGPVVMNPLCNAGDSHWFNPGPQLSPCITAYSAHTLEPTSWEYQARVWQLPKPTNSRAQLRNKSSFTLVAYYNYRLAPACHN